MSEIPLTTYGDWRVLMDRSVRESTTDWYVSHSESDASIELGDLSDELDAKALAATLDAAECGPEVLPPRIAPGNNIGGSTPWEEWATGTNAVPASIATASKAAVAGWLSVIYNLSASEVATELDVGEQTVRQYLSDLREGRR